MSVPQPRFHVDTVYTVSIDSIEELFITENFTGLDCEF